MVFTRAEYPEAPPVATRSSTLLDVATVRDGIKLLEGEDLFQSYNCLKFQEFAEFCAPNDKTFDQVADWIGGFRFAIYGGVTCNAIGLDEAEMLTKVTGAFNAGESTAVERALMGTRFTTDPQGRWDVPVDLTPLAGAVRPATGISLLEGFGATEYVGQPTLHVPYAVAGMVLATAGLNVDGSMVMTKMGSPVAVGAGYDFPNLGPDGSPAPAGERWIYATGGVVILRGDPIIRQVMTVEDNQVLVLAERPYIAAVDCFAAAIRVTVD